MKRTWLNDNPVGLWLAVAAQAVNAPRLILVYLRVDGILPPAWLEVILLALTGIATSLVLSGGGAYLAHTLATPTKRGGWWKVLLACIWLAMLACAVILVAPLLQAGMVAGTVATVLATAARQWTWSIVAVLAVEVVAAGSMLADALRADALPRTLRSRAPQAEPLPVILPTAAPAALAPLPAVAELRTYRCEVCGRNSMSQPQYAAHKRYCKPEPVPAHVN